MDFRFKSLLFVSVFCSAVLISVCFVPEALAANEESTTAMTTFPYIAQMTGDDVYIRSGPGTQYYRCGKLNKTNRVKIIGRQFSWSRIVPPAGSFSWISTQYVNVGAANSSIGTVTGDAVRVYAGSPHLKPMHSTTMQLKLNSDDKVRLLGEKSGGYYKIAPPTGAYLWVSTEYTKVLDPAGEVKLDVKPKLEPKPEPKAKALVVPTVISNEGTKLNKFYELEKQLATERNKAMVNQDYTKLKKAFGELAGDKTAGKAGRYAEFALEQIKRYELALAVGKEARLQDQNLRQIKGRIDTARAKRMGEIQRLDKFAVIGWFETSNIYAPKAGQKYYRIMDDGGKTVCYALATSVALRMDLSKFVGMRVGLIGEIKPHPETGGALVRFWRVWPIE